MPWCGLLLCWRVLGVLLRCFRHAGVWLVFRGFVGCLVVVGLRGCGWWCMLFSCCRSPAGFLRGVRFCRVCGGGLRTQERVCTTSFIVNDCQSGPRFRVGLLIVLRGSPRGRLMGVGVFVRVAFPY